MCRNRVKSIKIVRKACGRPSFRCQSDARSEVANDFIGGHAAIEKRILMAKKVLAR
jgi:hypothetical protein